MTLTQARLARVIPLILCFSLHTVGLNAQELKCDGLLPLQGSASGYQKRGNRCEGLYVSPTGADQGIAVISFTLGQLKFDLNSGIRLQVSALSRTGPVNLRAVAIPPKTYYRMDATVPAGSVFVWPVTEVLLPEGLGDTRIGVFGWKRTQDKEVLVPVRVTQQDTYYSGASSKPLLVIQPWFDSQKIKWRWGPAQGVSCLSRGAWQDAISQSVTAYSAVLIDLSRLRSGLNCVDVAAQSGLSGEWSTLNLRVEIPQR